MSASESARRGGQPSTTAPTPPPCDSPQVVTRNRRPQVLPTRREYSVSVDLVDPATSVDQAPGWQREGAGLLGQQAGQTAVGDRVRDRLGDRRRAGKRCRANKRRRASKRCRANKRRRASKRRRAGKRRRANTRRRAEKRRRAGTSRRVNGNRRDHSADR